MEALLALSWLSRSHSFRHHQARIGLLVAGACLLLLLFARAGYASPLEQTPTPVPFSGEYPPPPGPISLTDPVTDPNQPDVLYFPSTGHTLRGVFRDYWEQYGGLAQFGYPLTEEFFEPSGPSGTLLQAQYFERARFELHPENKGTPYEVLLGTLGLDYHPAEPPVPQQPSPALYFSQTGHNLSGEFQTYWQAHGGLFVNGYPISEPAMETNPTDGKQYMVQWFERARFELHPENVGTTYEVLLGLLGTQLVQQKGYDSCTFPSYGYAADFSWVAGHITMISPYWSASDIAGCSILQYGTKDQRVQLNKPDGLPPWPVLRDTVALGHLRSTKANEPMYSCMGDPDAPIYYIEHEVQFNPVP